MDLTVSNEYLYDAEGRVCAVASTPVPGMTAVTGYIYDGEGARVAKGTIPGVTLSSFSSLGCDPSAWTGFQFTTDYVLGTAGEELTEMSNNGGTWQWALTNVYAAGKLIGTYNMVSNGQGAQVPWLHFHLEDPLGTRRMQVSGMFANLGQPEMDCQSLPYGDQLNCYTDAYADPSAGDATPLHFTGKERDTESGNDYFEARYYSSSMGRFMSPDWSAQEEPVPYAKLDDPQTLNLYSYVQNNPLTQTDPTGHGTCPPCIDIDVPEGEELLNKIEGWFGGGTAAAGGAGGVSLSAVAVGASVPLVVATVFAPAVGGDMTPQEINACGDACKPPPQTSTSGAGARQGGGPPYENTPENQARMAQGKPPIGKDGKPVELHHTDQTQGGGTQEMTRTDHRAGTNYAANHTNTGQKQSQIDRKKFAQQRRSHWKHKVKPNPTSWRRTFRSRPHSRWVAAYQNRWTTVRKAAARTRES